MWKRAVELHFIASSGGQDRRSPTTQVERYAAWLDTLVGTGRRAVELCTCIDVLAPLSTSGSTDSCHASRDAMRARMPETMSYRAPMPASPCGAPSRSSWDRPLPVAVVSRRTSWPARGHFEAGVATRARGERRRQSVLGNDRSVRRGAVADCHAEARSSHKFPGALGLGEA